ncbi:MAG: aldo/keto reductase [Spirochaetaceae bacterium]
MEKLEFGKTNHLSTRILFGAAAFYDEDQKTADKTMELVIEKGINHIDTAASYGKSELRLGPWIKHHRDKFFLATKTEQRSKKAALEELYRSLDLLKTDHIDLWQMHLLIDEEHWQQTYGESGALEAFIEAKEKGLVKNLGITGHELIVPSMHLRSLKEFDFDSVLLPYNYSLMQIPGYKHDFNKLHALALKKKLAFQCIKTICRGPWGDKKQNYSTWYQPFDEQDDIDILIGYVLKLERSFINSAAEVKIFPKIIQAAENFDPTRNYTLEMAKLAESKGMTSLFR